MAAHYELMVREGDHRIKNSLQVVASLLGLQARRETSEAAQDAMRAAAARIQAVARIHDALQLDGGGGEPDIGALIATMSASLRDMADDPRSIEIIVRTQPIKIPLTLAQPLVLAVNELVINALRHAFPNGRTGTLTVTVGRDCDGVRIEVSDNGVGLPAGYGHGGGYGMTLVRAMIAKDRWPPRCRNYIWRVLHAVGAAGKAHRPINTVAPRCRSTSSNGGTLMSQANTKAAAGDPPSSASDAERAASLNADGTQKWFIPPYIIPAVIVLLIAARAIYLS